MEPRPGNLGRLAVDTAELARQVGALGEPPDPAAAVTLGVSIDQVLDRFARPDQPFLRSDDLR